MERRNAFRGVAGGFSLFWLKVSKNKDTWRTGIRVERAYTGSTMEKMQALQAAARQGGFVQVEESGEGTVLWLRKETADAATKTHQRICIDSMSNSLTVYWMTAPGKIDSKTFRNAPSLQEWFALQPAQ
jgi:hypothetical protein